MKVLSEGCQFSSNGLTWKKLRRRGPERGLRSELAMAAGQTGGCNAFSVRLTVGWNPKFPHLGTSNFEGKKWTAR